MPRKEITAVRKTTPAVGDPSTVVWEGIEEMAREHVRGYIQDLLEEELTEFLGRGRYERRAGDRTGYRNGHGKPRRLTMKCGTITVRRPRARNLDERFESRLLPFFVRRTREVDGFLPELYLNGPAEGDMDLALRGLLGDEAPISASTIARLKEEWHGEFDEWAREDLSGLEVVYLWIDGLYVKAGLEKEKAAVFVALARDQATDRERLVGTIQSLFEESGALQKERDELAEDLAEKEAKIEKGKKQLRKLQEQLHNTKTELELLKAGKAIPEEDEAALRELAREAGGVMAFFDRLGRIKWRDRSDLAASFAGLVADRAMDFADTMLKEHAEGAVDARQRKAFTKLSMVARTAADALTKGKLARKGKKFAVRGPGWRAGLLPVPFASGPKRKPRTSRSRTRVVERWTSTSKPSSQLRAPRVRSRRHGSNP